MIIRENIIEVKSLSQDFMLRNKEIKRTPEELIFFDLEHYVYKKPKCIGVFGACVYNENKLYVTQYMIENRNEVVDILNLAKRYFIDMKKKGKNAIVTFSGNNDYTVINYLFKKYNIEYNFSTEFEDIDIQKEYEKEKAHSIGLKNLEKEFGIFREGELISGSNLAKTFHKVLKDREYILRMPKEKIENILIYNEQDVTSLYNIYTLWKKYIIKDEKQEEVEDNIVNEFKEPENQAINDIEDDFNEVMKQIEKDIPKEIFLEAKIQKIDVNDGVD